ncbi:preprotein translocase subunit SecE [Natroniella sulfidigena]|uniref:preprotein translocase subunit SecE n=1 Tax=Natroniella sulfidigena TaxID=723921 RepID=UPI00200B1CB8|nr:preprotein translocase subunit SecE [Natroniella sulfidigena]MCK8816221.1 preprotein translocase subunit SecE [Natroniella sulfidigena]
MAKKSATEKLKKFLREVKAELRKVNWPSKQELVSYTMVVIATVILISIFIGGVDLLFSSLIRPIIFN